VLLQFGGGGLSKKRDIPVVTIGFLYLLKFVRQDCAAGRNSQLHFVQVRIQPIRRPRNARGTIGELFLTYWGGVYDGNGDFSMVVELSRLDLDLCLIFRQDEVVRLDEIFVQIRLPSVLVHEVGVSGPRHRPMYRRPEQSQWLSMVGGFDGPSQRGSKSTLAPGNHTALADRGLEGNGLHHALDGVRRQRDAGVLGRPWSYRCRGSYASRRKFLAGVLDGPLLLVNSGQKRQIHRSRNGDIQFHGECRHFESETMCSGHSLVGEKLWLGSQLRFAGEHSKPKIELRPLGKSDAGRDAATGGIVDDLVRQSPQNFVERLGAP
jgi:hypothetical protein